MREAKVVKAASFRREHELVPVWVFEHGGGAPIRLLGWLDELDAFGHELARSALDIIGRKGDMAEAADLCLVTGWGEEHQLCLASRETELDPTLFVVERLVGEHLEPK
jgi:hypothetical protein